MQVSDIMETTFATIGEDASYKDVADILHANNRGCVFVLDGLDRLVGLYTNLAERERKIEEVQDHLKRV